MTREQLMEMPISLLRGLDIKTQEEEALVQEVLEEKMKAEPTAYYNRVVFSSEETDKMTPEKERELQMKIDGIKVVAESIVEPVADVLATPVVEVSPETVTATRFCEYCDSKGVRHKKNCTRLEANGTSHV